MNTDDIRFLCIIGILFVLLIVGLRKRNVAGDTNFDEWGCYNPSVPPPKHGAYDPPPKPSNK